MPEAEAQQFKAGREHGQDISTVEPQHTAVLVMMSFGDCRSIVPSCWISSRAIDGSCCLNTMEV